MAQEGFDTLMKRIDSRYRLAMVAGRRAAQLKQGSPSSLTGKPIAPHDNAVTIAMKEIELGTALRWDDALPSAADIGAQVQRDHRDAAQAPATYSVLRQGAPGSDNAF